MTEGIISKILAKVPKPSPPELTGYNAQDLELLIVFRKNIDIYKSLVDKLKSSVFSTALTNSRVFLEFLKEIEETYSVIDNDISRINSGLKAKFVIDKLGCGRIKSRITKEQLLNNISIIDCESTIIEDSNKATFLLRLDPPKVDFPIRECPFCDQKNITNKEELIDHIKRIHISVHQYTKKKKIETKVLQKQPKIDFEGLGLEPSEAVISSLTSSIEDIFNIHYPSESYLNLKDSMIEFIHKRILVQLPSCELKKYGSSNNGFGTLSSDIDLSLVIDFKSVFKDPKFFALMSKEVGGEAKTIDLCELIILSKVCAGLNSGSLNVVDLEVRRGARIRIVNFKTPTEPQFEVDICLNNLVALENTDLLRTYSLIDERVVKIGIIVKIWAQVSEISNTHEGGLSAYAFILLVIFFFQKTSQPILPILQNERAPSKIVDGYECGFDSDYEKYRKIAKQNKETEGVLLYNFFHYYAHFDWKVNAIDIRNKGFTMKKKNDLPISIQDPFEINRDLGDTVKGDNFERIVNMFKSTLKDIRMGKPLHQILKIDPE